MPLSAHYINSSLSLKLCNMTYKWTWSLWSFHTEVTSSVQQQLWNSVSPLLSRVPFNKEPVQHKRQHGHKPQIEPVVDLRRLDAALTHFLHVGPLSSRTNLPKHIIVSKILISSKSTLKVVFHLIALLYSFKSTIQCFFNTLNTEQNNWTLQLTNYS